MEEPTKKPVNKIKVVLFTLLILFLATFLPSFLIASSIAKVMVKAGIKDPLKVVTNFLTTPKEEINSQDGKVGVLLLGKSGIRNSLLLTEFSNSL